MVKMAPAVLVIFAICACGTAQASPLTILNPSFELPALTLGNWAPGVTNWNGPGGVWYPSGDFSVPVPNGNQVMWLNGGTLSQQLTDVLTAGMTYTLSAYVGHRADNAWDPNYTVEVLAGTTTIAWASGYDPGLGLFGLLTLPSYKATGSDPLLGQPLSIAFTNTFSQTDFDNVQLDASITSTSIPEPSILVLLSAGLAGIVSAVWRRKF